MQMRRLKLRTTFWYLIEFELDYKQKTLQKIPHLMGNNLPTTTTINISTHAATHTHTHTHIYIYMYIKPKLHIQHMILT